MPIRVCDEKKRQMDDLINLMKTHSDYYNKELNQPVPVPLRLLYL